LESATTEIYTSDVVSSIRRILSFFPAEEEGQVRERLAENVQAVISLRLLPSKKGNGRVPAVEVMRMTRSLQSCIREPARMDEIQGLIARGREHMQMQTFDQHLLDLYRAGKISLETASTAASNPRDFATQLALEGDEPGIEGGGAEDDPGAPVEIQEDERF
jgi:twitching motility protein PilT